MRNTTTRCNYSRTLEEYLCWENLLMASNSPSLISCNLEPLPRGSVKFTVDGAAADNLAGCGRILREESGGNSFFHNASESWLVLGFFALVTVVILGRVREALGRGQSVGPCGVAIMGSCPRFPDEPMEGRNQVPLLSCQKFESFLFNFEQHSWSVRTGREEDISLDSLTVAYEGGLDACVCDG
ncbi:hypothetical protein GQ457_02G042080 [Hibiscus cannabinus]